MKRKPPSSKEKLAAALLQLVRVNAEGKLEPIIDRDWAKGQTPEAIISAFEVDHHPIPVALDGTNHPTNLQHTLKAEHRAKTAKKDIPVIAKVKRVSKKHAAHVAKIEAKATATEPAEPTQTQRVTFRGKAKWGPQKPLAGTKASGIKKSLGTNKVSTR